MIKCYTFLDYIHDLVFSNVFSKAFITDTYIEPIFSDGLSRNLVDLFDFGGWLVNPNRAADHGLVYDAGAEDDLHFLCASGYDQTSIKNIANRTEYEFPSLLPSVLDLNLPSITINFLKEDVTVIRTVTIHQCWSCQLSLQSQHPASFGCQNHCYTQHIDLFLIRQATQLQFHGIHHSQSQFHLLIWELDLDRYFSQGHHLNIC
ncbi:hypothetical protein Bca4012_000562 [Brassica carinata]|uniref:Uncharacterized protein n=2 Tax=Brassica oleracea TaxID=3712 RepID=A0A0D3B0Q3_BRAOL|nr:unnamed protein product [Brassica oleracea]